MTKCLHCANSLLINTGLFVYSIYKDIQLHNVYMYNMEETHFCIDANLELNCNMRLWKHSNC